MKPDQMEPAHLDDDRRNPIEAQPPSDTLHAARTIASNRAPHRIDRRSRFKCGPLAQLAEQVTLNPRVRGSNP